MRALLCQSFGTIDELAIADVAPPAAPASGEVLVEVAAAGVNFADILMVTGRYQEKSPLPFTPGLEAAGIVRACGSGVSRVKPGDRVIALVDRGAFAAALLARESDVLVMPERMDFATAAGFAIAYGTAHGALRWRADMQPGEVLLVHGAAGGVGLTAVEVGKAMGATVIATAGDADKLAIARSHGADHLIDYRKEDIRERVKAICRGGGADVVFDPVGGTAFEASLRCVNWGARLVVVGFAGGDVPQIPANILLVKNIAALGFYWGSYRKQRPELVAEQARELFGWWQEGRLRPRVSERFDLADAGKALALLRDRKATGKVVLTLDGR
ncbi:MAG TPA: NADPH:quinone oxidoreductase family protein [Methylomirabilota bacterium]|nr:NADPH:quinone oxidoreductase family protein [Methylomirabilota bacterium]